MKTIFKIINMLLFVMLFSGFTNAAASEWNIDPAHSNIYFDIRHIEGNKYLMTGDFTIKDVTHEIEVPFTYLGKKDSPSKPDELVAGFEAGFDINRLDYHVGNGKYYDMGVIAKDVHILISLELLKSK